MKNLYEGGPPAVPRQLERKTIMNLSAIPFERQDIFEFVTDALQNPAIRSDSVTLQNKADTYLCEFVASAIYDGALTHNFHRAVMSIKFSEIGLSPFNLRVPVSAEDPDTSSENVAFFRYWFSPLTEMYFLRLVLFLVKNYVALRLQLKGDYAFPENWRGEEKLREFAGVFDNWCARLLKESSLKPEPLGIRAFRSLSIANVAQKVPCFAASTLRGQLSCDSLQDEYLAALDDVLGKSHSHRFRYSTEDAKPEDSSLRDEAERIFVENRQLLLSDKKFSATMEKLKDVIENLPGDFCKQDRITAAERIEEIISDLPKEGSDTPQKFLFNVQILGKWLSYLLRNTKYDKGTIKTRADMVKARFLYMLGNQGIHELTTEQLIDVILKTYTAYDSNTISSTIRAFMDDLYDYQESIFPEMAWESLPWDEKDVLHKENIRRSKPLVTFQMVRDALKKITQIYPNDAKRLRVALILGFFAGLRIVEVSYLTLDSLMPDGGYTLAIRESKTQSGIRNIRLALLLHEDELKEVIKFFAEKRLAAWREGKSIQDEYLFSPLGPEEARKSNPVRVARIFKQLGYKIRFHHLRHTFANWFLVRAFAATRGLEMFPASSPFLMEKLFSDRHLGFVRRLVMGDGREKIGQSSFAYIMPTLAKIMGHYGPETTLTSYLHIVDWIYYLYARKEWDRITLTLDSLTVQDFVQLSYPSLPPTLKKRSLKGVPPSEIISAQLDILDKIFSKMNKENGI